MLNPDAQMHVGLVVKCVRATNFHEVGELGMIERIDGNPRALWWIALKGKPGHYCPGNFAPASGEEIFSALQRAALLKAEPADQSDGWQPIETAPKDGTVIDVWCASVPSFRIPEVIWEDRYQAFFSNEAGVLAGDISHWRPLPAPPAALQEEGRGS